MYIKNVFSASINGNPGEDAFQQAYPCKLDQTRGMGKNCGGSAAFSQLRKGGKLNWN
jgi:hypothetical protein